MTTPFDGRFANTTALVTGGGSGIGAALTEALVAAGSDVLCTDIDLAAAEAVAAAAVGPGSATALQLDVTDAAAVQAAVNGLVERTGRIDLLFNNAGIVYVGETQKLTLEQWNRIIDINVRGVVHGINAAYPHMIEAGSGHIINTSSAAGLMASGFVTSYVATKHAVVGLSLALHAEAAGHGVGVTVVCPAVVDTPILDKGDVGGMSSRSYFEGAARLGKPYAAADLAHDVLAGVAQNKAMLVVPRALRVAWRLQRLSPAFMQWSTARSISGRRAASG